jgi:signal transduction histidine kinase
VTIGPIPSSGACPCWLREESHPIRNHELRTPITLIAGHAEGLLRRGAQPPALQLIQQEAQRMGTLVSDLLDLARNDAGRLRLQASAQAPRANADPRRLQQCLTALVDNALLYSDGLVTLAASTGPSGELVLHVIDRGPARPAWPALTAAVASASRWCVC